MRGLKPLELILTDVGAVGISPGLESWLISWWEANLKKIQPSDWFEV